MKFLSVALLTSWLFTAQASALNCSGISIEKKSIFFNVNPQKKQARVAWRCYETGDIWWDCDEESGRVTQAKLGAYRQFSLKNWRLIVQPGTSPKAVLYSGQKKWGQLQCR